MTFVFLGALLVVALEAWPSGMTQMSAAHHHVARVSLPTQGAATATGTAAADMHVVSAQALPGTAQELSVLVRRLTLTG